MINIPCNILKENDFERRIVNETWTAQEFSRSLLAVNMGTKLYLERNPGGVRITLVDTNSVSYEIDLTTNIVNTILEYAEFSNMSITIDNDYFYSFKTKAGNYKDMEVILTITIKENTVNFTDKFCSFSVDKKLFKKILLTI